MLSCAGARVTTVGLAALAAAHLLLAGGLLAAEVRADTASMGAWANLAVGVVVVPLTIGLSLLTARRPEGAVVGTLLGLLGVAVAHVVAKEVWLGWLATATDARSWAWLVAVTAEDAWWVLVAFALLLLVFPDGRLPARRWRWLPPTLIGCTAITQGYGAVENAPSRRP